MLLAANVTTDLHILSVVFNLSYTLIPLISIGLSWWIVRKTAPALIVWPVLGIGLLLVSGQIFFIIETIAVVELFWPILLALLVRPPRKMNFIIALLAIIIAFSHLFGIILIGCASILNAVIAWKTHSYRRWLGTLGFMIITGIAAFIFLTYDAASQPEFGTNGI